MNSVTTSRYREAFSELPVNIKQSSRKAYKLWKVNPRHPSLQFKQVHKTKPIFSVRVGLSWRALGIKEGNTMIWFWIGSHADYDKLIKEFR